MLAFGAVSLIVAYTQLPNRVAEPERTLPFAQVAPAADTVAAGTAAAGRAAADTAAAGTAAAGTVAADTVASGTAVPGTVASGTMAAPALGAIVQDPESTASAQEASAAPVEPAAAVSRGLIFLDPGHQRRDNSQQEPVSPGSKETKAKVTGGTSGVATGKPEYMLNLEVAVLLKQALIQKGFEVQMTREEHDVDISNVERAEMANAAGAQLAIRIHADGNVSPKAKGFSVLYPDAGVKATQSIQPASRKAAEAILEALKTGTEAASRGMVARSDLTGFNWSKVPVVLIEMGFMTNPAEDEQMSDPEYQQQMADAITEGIDVYMRSNDE